MRKPGKILFLLTQDLSSPSGLGRYGPLGAALVGLGYRVQIAALHPNYRQLDQAARTGQFNGAAVQYVAPMHVKKSGDQKTYYPAHQLLPITIWGTWKLTQAALASKADIIHLGKPHPMNSLAGWLVGTLGRRPLILDSDDLETASTRFQGTWQREIVQRVERWTPRQAALITTNTLYQKELLQRAGFPPEKVLYLPNGVDRQRFREPQLSKVDDLRGRLGLEDKRVVAFLGSLSLPSHPIDLLIPAFKEIQKKIQDTALLLVGGGEDMDRLRQMAVENGLENKVVFTGRVAPEEIPLYYRLASVTVDPARDDEAASGRCPLKIFESWACGIPVVTADVGDRAHILGNPPSGKLARPDDPHALASEILHILEEERLAAELAARGLERVKNYYWDELVQILDQAYQEFLRTSGNQ